MQQQNIKSATTAGLLGIFLGSFGAHNWYLGEKNKGIIHVCMMSGGILVDLIASAILPNVLSFSALFRMAWLFTILYSLAALAMSASAIWGLIEGIMIISQGDAGLARRGYMVAQPAVNQNFGYQYPPNQPQDPYNQGYNQNYNQGYYGPQNYNYGPQNFNQPMNNQPFGGQPMNNQPMNGQPMDGSNGQPTQSTEAGFVNVADNTNVNQVSDDNQNKGDNNE